MKGIESAHLQRRRTRIIGIAAAVAALVVLVGLARGANAADCTEHEVEIGIVHVEEACLVWVDLDGGFWETHQTFRMNGLEITPDPGVFVRFRPGSKEKGVAPGVLSVKPTRDGPPSLEARTLPHNGKSDFSWRVRGLDFTPPSSGEILLFEEMPEGPVPAIFGVQPLVSLKEPVYLNDRGGGRIGVSYDILSILKLINRNQAVGIDWGLEESGEVSLEGVRATVKGFQIGSLINVKDLELEGIFHDKKLTGLDASLKAEFERIGNFELIGGFKYDGAVKGFTLGVNDVNKPLGTSGIFLQQLSGQVGFDPFGIKGNVGLTAGNQVKILNKDIAAFRVDGGIEVHTLDAARNKPPWLAATGNVKVIGIPMADGHFRYDFGVGTDFGVSVGIGVPSFTNDPSQPTYLGARVDGWTTANAFLLTGQGKLKVIGFDLLEGDVLLSNMGMGACAHVLWWYAGAGVRWSDGQVSDIGGNTCDIGRYRPAKQSATALASGRAELSLGAKHEIIRVRGEGAPPRLTLRHRDGRAISTPPPNDGDGMLEAPNRDGVALSMKEGDTVFFMIRDPGGNWALEPHESSSEIRDVSYAKELPPHNVRAGVRGSGRTRTLRWRAREIPHQKLVFVEVLRDGSEVPILQTERHRGSRQVRLADGPGSYGRRKLKVHVVQRFETPRDELVAGRFTVRPPRKPAKPKLVRADRRLRDVVVRWKPPARAAKQEVVVRSGDGARYSAEVGRGAGRHRFRDISGGETMTVKVFGMNRDRIRGRAGSVALANSDHVGSGRHALRVLLKQARVNRAGKVVSRAVCPNRGAHCAITLKARNRKGRVLGRADTTLPSDMTDRIIAKVGHRASLRPLRVVGVVRVGTDKVLRAKRRLNF